MAFALPLTPFFNSLALSFLILMNVWFAISERSKFRPEFLLLAVPIVLQLVTLIYAFDKTDAVAYLIRQSPMLLLPLLVGLNWGKASRYQGRIRNAYYIGLFLSCIISLSMGAVDAISTRDWSAMQYYALADVLSMHPTYYSLYLVTGLGLLLFDKKVDARLWALYGGMWLVTLVFLQSRMALLLVILLILGKVLSGTGRKAIKQLLPILALLVLFLLVFPGVTERGRDLFIESGASEELIGTTDETGVSQRAWLWRNAVERIWEQPIKGYGLRSQRSLFQWQVHKDALAENRSGKYMEAAWYVGSLNLHNQFLQWAYEGGLIILLIIIGSMIALITISWHQRNWNFLLAYFIFICFLCSENLLDRQLGIYFYSFMLTVLLTAETKPNKIEDQ